MIKAVVFDIDGVLTDGRIYINEKGEETKCFRLTEIDALNSLKDMGFKLIAITGEETRIVEVFKTKTTWTQFITGCKDKASMIRRIEESLNLCKDEICYIGDGKYDIEAIKYVGMGVCPSNAIQEVKDVADIVLSGSGGESCVYELYKLLMEGR